MKLTQQMIDDRLAKQKINGTLGTMSEIPAKLTPESIIEVREYYNSLLMYHGQYKATESKHKIASELDRVKAWLNIWKNKY